MTNLIHRICEAISSKPDVTGNVMIVQTPINLSLDAHNNSSLGFFKLTFYSFIVSQ